MRADKIPNIIHQLNQINSPYQCVMISGEWGIGKSYQVNAGIQQLKSVGYCSLFGVDSMGDIFGQVLFRLTLNKNRSHINFKQVADTLDLGKLDPIKKVLGNVFSPQMALEYVLNQYEQKKKTSLLIFDDIERISDSIDFDLFLGMVESLMQTRRYVKILFIANLSQFSEKQKLIWDKYSEKVIDQVFPIEDLAENISILETPELNTAAVKFMKQHGSKNLRTLQKAHRFFLDVSHKISLLDRSLLKNSVIEQLLCMACYSVVFESVEKIYEREGQRLCEEASKLDTKEASYLKIVRQLEYKDIESIICNKYLDGVTATDAKQTLVKELVCYYLHGNENIPVLIEALIKTQEVEKPTFYCSDDEVKVFVNQQRERLSNHELTNLFQFLQIADSIFVWSKVLGIDTTNLVLTVKERVPELYVENNRIGQEQPWSLCHYNDYLSSNELKEILHSLEAESEKIYFQNVVKSLSNYLNLKDYSNAYNQLRTIQLFFHRTAFLNAIDSELFFSVLCNDALLPLGSCSETQYYCEQIAYAIAMTIDKESYIKYLESVKFKFSSDKMFLERMLQIEKAYQKALVN